jgi:hypothetical protein
MAVGTTLEVRNVMHQVAERIEVGSLRFSRVNEVVQREPDLVVALQSEEPMSIGKLVVSESGVTVESGIRLHSDYTNEAQTIDILPADAPFMLFVGGLPGGREVGVPEYPIQAYRVRPCPR